MIRYNNYHKHDHVSNIFSPDSNAKAEDYIKKCIEYGHTNYFTTNHGSFGDIFEAHTLCEQYGLKCIAGIEGYIVPNPEEKDKSNYHIIVIPKTDTARKKMNYVSSRANEFGFYYKPRFFIQDLLDLDKDDIFITTACVQGLLKDKTSYQDIFLPLMKYFGENMLLEVQTHNHPIQIEVNKRALQLKDKFGLRLIAANDSHYIDEQGAMERLEFLKGKHITYDEEDSFILDFPTAEIMFDRFDQQNILSEDDIEEAIKNTLLFDDCESIQLDYSIKMPTIDPDLTPAERVEKLKKIIAKRFSEICKEEHIVGDELKKYKEGIRYEMDIIEKTNEEVHTADYFLFNTKNVALAVNKYGGVLTRGGRGSCASFYINRILGMTQLDRFQINLPIFPDRFASTARLLSNRNMPDIDFNIREQEPFVSASRELLGEHGCYPMYAPNTMQLSEAFRNVCRSKSLNYDLFNEVAKNVEDHLDDPEWQEIIEEANKYVGTIVSGSVHPCAHLLSDKDIRYEYGLTRLGEHLCVLITSSEADEYKVLKNDYLIVSVWKLISETFEEVGIPIIPARQLLKEIKDDDRIWQLFQDGITCTLNQVDSNNGTRQAKQYGIESFEDGALITAAIRPSFDAWREQFLNHEEYSTGSKQLDEVLSQTSHYILYQESLMQYFDWLGVTPAESIGLIKKISKKKIKPDDFKKLEERLRKNWIKQTGSEDNFDKTWEMIQGCMAYGFCSAHAAATSLDMCYGAYLKVHYPVQYYTVCLNNYVGDFERTNKLTNELEYFGIKLKGIVFRHSKGEYSYDLDTRTIYKGLTSIKYMSDSAANDLDILKDRDYNTFIDLLIDLKSTSINSRQLEILTKLNFFNEFGHINELLAQTELFNKLYGKKQLKKDKLVELDIPEYVVAQHSQKQTEKIFKDIDSIAIIKDICANTTYKKTPVIDRVKYEFEYLGYSTITNKRFDEDHFYVIDLPGSYKNMLSLYNLRDGHYETTKFQKSKTVSIPEPGNVIKVLERVERNKKKLDHIDEDGRKIFVDTPEREIAITKYCIIA